MPRAGLTRQVVVEEAERLVDEVGLERLTLAALAARLGVKQPSLYKHIDGVAALHRDLAVWAGREMTEALQRAAVGRSRGDAIYAIADAHREWASAHPRRYQLSQVQPAPDDVEHKKLEGAYLQVFTSVLAGFGLADADAIDAIRGLRSALHGFVILEAAGGFAMPYDVDRSYRRMVTTHIDAFEHWAS